MDYRRYPLPKELSQHVGGEEFAPDELRGACHRAGEGLGGEDAANARFRPAAEMVALWRGLDLPAWEAPYALRAARLGYIHGYTETLFSDTLTQDQTERAAHARWGENWRSKLEQARERATEER